MFLGVNMAVVSDMQPQQYTPSIPNSTEQTITSHITL